MLDAPCDLAVDLDGVRQDHNCDGIFAPDRFVSDDRRTVKFSDDVGHGRTLDCANDRFGSKLRRLVHDVSPKRRVVIAQNDRNHPSVEAVS